MKVGPSTASAPRLASVIMFVAAVEGSEASSEIDSLRCAPLIPPAALIWSRARLTPWTCDWPYGSPLPVMENTAPNVMVLPDQFLPPDVVVVVDPPAFVVVVVATRPPSSW